MTVYLDNAATTRVREEAAAAALSAMREDFGNPSSTHLPGRAAADILERARADVASVLGVGPESVAFTSGGTEANNWAVLRGAESRARAGRHVITSSAEHDSVRRSAEHLSKHGYDVTFLTPSPSGAVRLEDVASAMREDTILISLMLVNNETGAVNPIAEIAGEIKRRGFGALLHTDAVQAYGKLPLSLSALGADLVSVSAHKIYGAKGAGALIIRPGVRLPPLLLGGGQENERRAGTHAMPAVAAFGEAARLAKAELPDNLARAEALKALAIAEITARLPNAVVISPADGSPYILSVSLPGHRGETLTNALDAERIYVSRSSACKKGARSHVLDAMRLPPNVIDGALRVSFSRETTADEVRLFAESLERVSKAVFTRRR
ncbi:MAG: cysteine desulfurase [Oscillospiraceae bacterium]|jgi:cysteine desulfurase|nr:cysteine desulfurase [Oscillospiraceae bacterium]